MKRQLHVVLILCLMNLLWLNDTKAQTNSPVAPQYVEIVATVIVNGETITFEQPILNDNGSLLLPMRTYYEAIGAQVYWNSETKTASAVRNKKTIDLTINSYTALIDKKSVSLLSPAILYNNQTYVPLRFIGESFNGSVNWQNETKTVTIQFRDSGGLTLTSTQLSKELGRLPLPNNVNESDFADERRLLISDNPERLSATTSADRAYVLAYDTVKTLEKSNEHRIFGWHVNDLGVHTDLGIVIENLSKTQTLTIRKTAEASFSALESLAVQQIGLPIAEATLLNKVLTSDRSRITIGPGETKVISTYELKQGLLRGFSADLTITTKNSGYMNYTIRTVSSTLGKASLLEAKDPVVALDSIANHPRGVWPSSSLATTLPTYTIGDALISYSISNGQTDHQFIVENALSKPEETIANRGHFGVSYKVQIPIINETKRMKGVVISVAGRGGAYSGIVKYRDKTYLIPEIQAGAEYVQLPTFYTRDKESLIELEVFHAGGSNLPVAIYLETK